MDSETAIETFIIEHPEVEPDLKTYYQYAEQVLESYEMQCTYMDASISDFYGRPFLYITYHIDTYVDRVTSMNGDLIHLISGDVSINHWDMIIVSFVMDNGFKYNIKN